MSGVYAKDRKETKLMFHVVGQKLQIALTKFVMSDKNVPKKYRFIISQPLIAKVDEMMDHIVYANTIFPTTEEELADRKHHQQLAIICCYQLQNKLIRLIEVLQTKPSKLAEALDSLGQEVILLKAWKKSSKIY